MGFWNEIEYKYRLNIKTKNQFKMNAFLMIVNFKNVFAHKTNRKWLKIIKVQILNGGKRDRNNDNNNKHFGIERKTKI